MSSRFEHHYTREEATALLPEVRGWLTRARGVYERKKTIENRVEQMMGLGNDVGGGQVNELMHLTAELQEVMLEFERREILVKDIERGIVDFPSIVEGREVFLCWEWDEPSVEYWHELDGGYAGREKLY